MNEYEITVQIAKLKGWEIVEETPEKVTWRSPQGKDFDVWPPLDQTIYFIPGFPMPLIKMAEAWDLLDEISIVARYKVGVMGFNLNEGWRVWIKSPATWEVVAEETGTDIKSVICRIYLAYREDLKK